MADRGPRQQVPPEWVPQMQLHMLCAGTPSCLLVSRSATRGTRVFRLARDAELQRLMLLGAPLCCFALPLQGVPCCCCCLPPAGAPELVPG